MMIDQETQSLLDFLNELEKLKIIYRKNNVIDRSRAENSAEHSWHVALMALVFCRHEEFKGIDLLKTLKMILIHDIVEIDAGDHFVFSQAEISAVEKKERQASERLFGMLPEPLCAEFLGLWREFEERKTAEARLAKSLDAIQPLLNHLTTTDVNENPDNITENQVMRLKQKIKNDSAYLWNIAEYLIGESVAKGIYTAEKS
jgi:putative hydrolase of HD superfamily